MSTSNGQSRLQLPKMNLDLSGASDAAVIKSVGETYAKLNETWAAAEADLLKFSVPVPVVLELGEDDNETSYMGFLRWGAKWHICLGYQPHHEEDVGDYHWTPITECPLGVRLSMVERFGELRVKVREAAEQTVADVNAAISKLKFELQ
jgi:hypothetical protein